MMSTTEKPSAVEQKIIRQIEYYFGDFNLPKDKFLQEETKKDDGWVLLETMTKFKRLASLSSDCNVIAEALKKSRSSLMQISEDNTKIRRNPDNSVPSTMKDVYDKYEDRTLFVKGFKTTASLDEVERFFDKAGIIVSIVMRRCVNRKGFKGSVFVTFQDKEESDKFLTSPEFESYDDAPLIRMLRTAYMEKKAEEKQKQKATRAEAQADADKKRSEMRQARFLSRMTLGALLELSGLPKGIKESETVAQIKAMMRKTGTPDVAFVEADELSEGRVVVRFKEENSAAQAMSKLQSTEDALIFLKPSKEGKPAGQVSASGDSAGSKEQVKSEPDAENAAEPEAENAAEPDAENAAEPDAENAADADAENAAEPDAENAAEPDAENAAEPDAENAAEPDVEMATEPAAEKAAEPDAEMAAGAEQDKTSEEQNGNAEEPVEPKQEIKEEEESTLVCRVLSGEEEQKLWERILEYRDKRQMNRKGKHGYGGHRDEPHRKRQRVSNK